MKRIFKYEIKCNTHKHKTNLDIPLNNKLLDIAMQNGNLYAWFEVPDSENSTERRDFIAFHTGKMFNASDLIFIKTIVCSSSYVVHIYEKEKFITADEMEI